MAYLEKDEMFSTELANLNEFPTVLFLFGIEFYEWLGWSRPSSQVERMPIWVLRMKYE